MKQFPLSKFIPFAIFILSLSSCDIEQESETLKNTTFQASVDKANLRENGSSKITYNSKTRENMIFTTEITFYGVTIPKTGYQNDAYPYQPDSVARTPEKQLSLGIRPGIEYIGKGAKFPGGNFNIDLNYLEIPIDVVAHVPAGPGDAHFGLGPYFAQGIGGGGPNGVYGQDAGGFKRFDAGLNLLLGYRFDNGIAIDLGYDLGLANVEYANEDVSGHTRTFSLNFGYQIGRLFTKKK